MKAGLLALLIAASGFPGRAFAQNMPAGELGDTPARQGLSLRDSLDHGFDLSDYLIDKHGFIPLPVIITEPALGGFGIGLVPVFLTQQPRPPGIPPDRYLRPDMTAGVAVWTVNGSWVLGGGRMATLQKQRMRYMVGAVYGDINLTFYRNDAAGAEHAYDFNFRTAPLVARLVKQIARSEWYAGGQYAFANVKVRKESGAPGALTPREVDSNLSAVAPMIEYDRRDNFFTPHRGIKVHADAQWSDGTIGSDYDFTRGSLFGYGYVAPAPAWTIGIRADVQQIWGDPPFYLLPFISLRGIPFGRYQGHVTTVAELEARWDVVMRWSLVGFGGVGRAFASWNDAGSARNRFAGGAGFRYLVARKFGVRCGIDVAHGPEDWAWYIVFGSAWLK